MWYPVSGVTGVPSVLSVGATQDSVAVPLVFGVTVTVALWLVVPPAPVQLNVYTVVALRAPVDCDPLIACAPLHPPDAVQAVALVEVQLKVDVPPLLTLVGLALKDTVGAGDETVTVADCDAEPPAPVQVRVNLVVAVSAGVVCVPAVTSEPLQPPEAVQAVALVDDQVSAEVAPLLTVAGFTVRVTAGAGVVTDTVADCVAVPPLPLQVSV
jgi:hypothetical protein